ncbi:MAG: CvpA family protein [Gallionella sp.]|nr:CvpA family protein [Gallionella sp.]
MSGFDFAVAGILLASLLLGLWRGLVYEVLSLLGWPVAFVLSKLFAGNMAPMLPIPVLSHAEGTQEHVRIAVAYAVVFIAALIVWGVLAWLLSRLMKAVGLGWLDRLLGGLFGLLRGGFVVLALVWLAGLTDIPKQPFWRGAQTSKAAEDAALLTRSWLPDSVASRIHYRARS